MTRLLTRGAGHIGAYVARALQATGRDVVVLDDLSTGLPGRIPPGVRLLEASVLDYSTVLGMLRRHRVEGVIHLASSCTEPARTHQRTSDRRLGRMSRGERGWFFRMTITGANLSLSRAEPRSWR